MKRSNNLLGVAFGMALIAAPVGNVFAAGSHSAAYQAGIEGWQKALAAAGVEVPTFAVGNCYDYFPLAVDNVLGLRATLEVSNLNNAGATFDICAVPAGTTEFTCRNNVSFNARDARFFSMPQISGAFTSTVGQLYVFPHSTGAAGASQLFIFTSDGTLSAVINATEFCP
jgi:hypothetical protein